MTSFYTRKGDDGYTGLLGEGRIAKYDLRMETLGTIDETTSAIGIARSQCKAPEIANILLRVQQDLYGMMGEIASTPENAQKFRVIDDQSVAWLEGQTDQINQIVVVPKEFIIPGDTPGAAYLDLARTITRRAERRLAALIHEGGVENQQLLRYLNRLSSLCFILELRENQVVRQTSPTLVHSDRRTENQ